MKNSPENRRNFSGWETCSVFTKIKAVKERPNSDNARAFQRDRPHCIMVKTYTGTIMQRAKGKIEIFTHIYKTYIN